MIKMIECNFKLEEKEFQDLMEIYLRRVHSHTRVEIFRELYVCGSVADFVVFTPYQKGIIHIYELKMYWDKDIKRLKRQIKDYIKVCDYLTIAIFGGVPNIKLPDYVNIINVRIINGRLTYNYINKEFQWDKKNKLENINIKQRLSFMKSVVKLWETKAFYGKKIIGVIQRKIIRQEKKLTVTKLQNKLKDKK